MCGRAERVEQHRHERVHGANCRALWRQARLKAVFEQPADDRSARTDDVHGNAPRRVPAADRRGRLVIAVGVDPTGRRAFTAYPEGTVRYWDMPSHTPLGHPVPAPVPR